MKKISIIASIIIMIDYLVFTILKLSNEIYDFIYYEVLFIVLILSLVLHTISILGVFKDKNPRRFIFNLLCLVVTAMFALVLYDGYMTNKSSDGVVFLVAPVDMLMSIIIGVICLGNAVKSVSKGEYLTLIINVLVLILIAASYLFNDSLFLKYELLCLFPIYYINTRNIIDLVNSKEGE